MPKVLNAVTPSKDRTSTVMDIRHAAEASVQISITNTNTVGVLYVQGSNDNSTWTNVGFVDSTGSVVTSVAVSSGTDINDIFNLSGAGFAFARIFFDWTSGGASDSLTAVSFHKATTR